MTYAQKIARKYFDGDNATAKAIRDVIEHVVEETLAEARSTVQKHAYHLCDECHGQGKSIDDGIIFAAECIEKLRNL